MISGFSYTMLGFLAAVIAIFFTIFNTQTFKDYVNRKNINVFMSLYFIAIFYLVLNSFVSLYNFSERDTYYAFNIMIFLFTLSLSQVVVVTYAIFGVAYKAMKKHT
jgi:hypothetical protein